MKCTLEEGQKSFECKLRVSIPATEIDAESKAKVMEYSKTAALPGFRAGKVRPEVIKDRFGKGIRAEVIQKAIQEYYKKALEKEKINPINQAMIEMITDVEGQDVEFSASFEVIPKIDLKGTKGLNIKKQVASLTDADLAEVLHRMQKQQTKFHNSEKAAQNEDRLSIDFEGLVNGETFKGGSAQDFQLILGSGQMIAGFEAGLLGTKVDEERELNLVFPAEYHVPDLAGKPVVFKVKIKKIESPELPELNDEFASQYNVFTMDELRAEVRQNMTRELKAKLKLNLKNQVLDVLLGVNEIEAVPSLLEQEAQNLAYQTAQQMGLVDRKTGKMKMNVPSELFKEAAEKRVRAGILMIRLIETLQVKADKAAVEAALEEFVQVFEDKEDVKRDYAAKPEQMMHFHQQVLEDQVIEKLLETANITEEPRSFFEIIDKQ